MCPTATCGILHNFVEYSNQNSTSLILNEIENEYPFRTVGNFEFWSIFCLSKESLTRNRHGQNHI